MSICTYSLTSAVQPIDNLSTTGFGYAARRNSGFVSVNDRLESGVLDWLLVAAIAVLGGESAARVLSPQVIIGEQLVIVYEQDCVHPFLVRERKNVADDP